MPENKRETGVRISRERTVANPTTSPDAAENDAPETIGNSQPINETEEKTRHSDGVNPPKGDLVVDVPTGGDDAGD